MPPTRNDHRTDITFATSDDAIRTLRGRVVDPRRARDVRGLSLNDLDPHLALEVATLEFFTTRSASKQWGGPKSKCVSGRDRAILVAKVHQFPRLVMCSRAGLHANEAVWQASEKGKRMSAPDTPLQNDVSSGINTVDLKD